MFLISGFFFFLVLLKIASKTNPDHVWGHFRFRPIFDFGSMFLHVTSRMIVWLMEVIFLFCF